MLDAGEIRALLSLEAHPLEGGFFAETWRAKQTHAGRPLGTAIYYLLTPETFSAMHRLPWDEVFHFYLGDPVEMPASSGDGKARPVLPITCASCHTVTFFDFERIEGSLLHCSFLNCDSLAFKRAAKRYKEIYRERIRAEARERAQEPAVA